MINLKIKRYDWFLLLSVLLLIDYFQQYMIRNIPVDGYIDSACAFDLAIWKVNALQIYNSF